MANAEKGEVRLVVGETTYTLRFDWNSIAEVEDILSPLKFWRDIAPKFNSILDIGAGEWRAMLWAALRGGGHEDIDLLQAGKLMGVIGFEVLNQKINEAVAASFPVEASGKSNPPKARRSTGAKR
jgi:hypothetical protein